MAGEKDSVAVEGWLPTGINAAAEMVDGAAGREEELEGMETKEEDGGGSEAVAVTEEAEVRELGLG
jgi:hypothetical protein